jgi:dipeptidyl aminopeptidase/acylaminoacyl peptidase
VCCLAALGLWNAPGAKARPVKQYTIEQFMNTTSLRAAAFSPDETKILFSSDRSGVYNAYSVPVVGGEATQITNSKADAIFSISYFPGDERILYRSDRGGNEIAHLYGRDLDGSVRDLTPGEKARAEFHQWSHDRKRLFFGWSKRDPKFMDLYEMDIESFTPRLIYQNDAGYVLSSVSNDNRYLAWVKPISTNNSEMYLYDRESQALKHLSPHQGDVKFTPKDFSADSKSLYYLTDEGSEFTYLKRYDLASGASETVEEADWDISDSYLSRNGKYRVVAVNNDAKTEIRVYEAATGRRVELPKVPAGDIVRIVFSDSERRMALYGGDSKSPNNLFVYDLETKQSLQLTSTLNPEVDPRDLVEGQVVRYKSYDGLEIPAVLYKPHQVEPGHKAPALVWVHGGPGGQSRLTYFPLLQFLINHGYVVLAVNNRGSTGDGKSFYAADDRKHGQADLGDCVEAKKLLVSTGYVDGEKIGIIGGSYGGYMTLAALAFRPEEFAVGVDIYGPSNWLRTLQSVPPWWEAFKQALYKEMGDPATDAARLREISPLFHADRIVRPLMVLQGANDPRVLKVESDEIVEAVRKKGVPVEYLLFDDEGHGFMTKKNQISGYQAILEFLDRHLKNRSES